MRAGVDAPARALHPHAVHTRPATADDIPALHALVESAYRGEAARGGWTHEADLLEGQRTDPGQLARMIDDPKQTFLVAEDAAGLLASVLVVDRPASALLSVLSVRPGAQGRGTGAAMIAAAEAHALNVLGRDRIAMNVIAQRPELIAYYERRGYALTGATVPFPYGEPAFGIPRRDDLVLLVMAKSITGTLQ